MVNAAAVGVHNYAIAVTSTTGRTATIHIAYTVTLDTAEATIALTEDLLNQYNVTGANTRFTNGLQFTISDNIDSVSVNGTELDDFTSPTLTAVAKADAVAIGAHTYDVVVTSTSGDTATITVAYEVIANQVTPTVSVAGGTPASTYTAAAAADRFAGDLQVTVSHAALLTINGAAKDLGIAEGEEYNGAVVIALAADAAAEGVHTYNIAVTSTTGRTATINVSYEVSDNPSEPIISLTSALLNLYTDDTTRFNSGLQFTVANVSSVDNVTVNGQPAIDFGGSLGGDILTAVDTANAIELGAHTYTIVVTSDTGHTASITVAYEIEAHQVTPSVTPTAAVASSYAQSVAATRFGSGLQVHLTNAALLTVNGTEQALVLGGDGMFTGDIIVEDAMDAQALGAHNYSIAVTSATGRAATINIAYTVVVNQAIPTIGTFGTALLNQYTVSEANARFASGLQFTISANAASATVNGGSPANFAIPTMTAVNHDDAVALGAHTYSVVVTSTSEDEASITVAYEVVDNPDPILTMVQVTGISDTSATISWVSDITPDTDGNSIMVSRHTSMSPLDTSIDGDGIIQFNDTTSPVTYTLNGILLPGTTYYCQVATTGTNGQTTTSAVFSFKTAPGAGGIVVNYQLIKSFALPDNTYANGWEFKFNITVNDPAETQLKMKFTNWINNANGGTNPIFPNMGIPTNGNMKVSLIDDIGTAVAIGNSYDDQATALSLVDENPNEGGIQESIYVFIKVPTSTAPGAFSASYGIITIPGEG